MWESIANMLYGSVPVRRNVIAIQPPVIPDAELTSPSSSATDVPSAAPDEPAAGNKDGQYKPSVVDVLVVKVMLNRAMKFPLEVIDAILDFGAYWPSHTVQVNYGDQRPRTVRGRSRPADPSPENIFLIRTPPLGLRKWGDQTLYTTPSPPRRTTAEWPADAFQDLLHSPTPVLGHPCRRIVFTITSHDQGWGGHGVFDDDNNPANEGPYFGSWTWFEAGLERFSKNDQDEKPSLSMEHIQTIHPEVCFDEDDKQWKFDFPLNPSHQRQIQANLMADGDFMEHRVVWDYMDDIDPEQQPDAAAEIKKAGRGFESGNGKFVRELQIGDMITVWALARFPGWCNYIKSVKVEVFWAM